MDVLILADFCGSLDGKSNNRFAYLAERLVTEGHSVEILTSDFNHGPKEHFKSTPAGLPYTVTLLHESGYPKNICLKRFRSHYVWSKNIRHYLKGRKKPDVIYAAIPPLCSALEAAKYCEKNGIKFVIDIQDLWPEAFQMVFNIPVISSIIFAPFKWIANAIYKRADEVCAVSETYVDRALKVNKKVSSGYAVFLGTELATFDENVRNNPSVIHSQFPNQLTLGYCGSLGDSYDINCVIDALAMLDNPPKFIVMGDGQKKEEFEQYAKDKGVDALFTGRLPYDRMCGVLAACDMVVNPIAGKSAASIINKHADYAASGLPVINTQDSPEYRKLVDDYQMGFNVRNGDAGEMAEKIKTLVEDEALRKEMGKNSRRCAEEKFDRGNTYSELIETLCR